LLSFVFLRLIPFEFHGIPTLPRFTIGIMAKWGEGDDRWKVQELGTTGRNVNGWHWEESDVLPWAKRRLSELFPSTLVLLADGSGGSGGSGGLQVTADGKVSVSGEAVINRRKGKVGICTSKRCCRAPRLDPLTHSRYPALCSFAR